MKCMRASEIMVEQQPPQEMSAHDSAGLVINFLRGGCLHRGREEAREDGVIESAGNHCQVTRAAMFEWHTSGDVSGESVSSGTRKGGVSESWFQ